MQENKSSIRGKLGNEDLDLKSIMSFDAIGETYDHDDSVYKFKAKDSPSATDVAMDNLNKEWKEMKIQDGLEEDEQLFKFEDDDDLIKDDEDMQDMQDMQAKQVEQQDGQEANQIIEILASNVLDSMQDKKQHEINLAQNVLNPKQDKPQLSNDPQIVFDVQPQQVKLELLRKAIEQTEEIKSLIPLKAKRGRGRPKKIPEVQVVQKVKKAIGRPRKPLHELKKRQKKIQMLANSPDETSQQLSSYKAFEEFRQAVENRDQQLTLQKWAIYRDLWKDARTERILGVEIPSLKCKDWQNKLLDQQQSQWNTFRQNYRLATKTKGGLTFDEYAVIVDPNKTKKKEVQDLRDKLESAERKNNYLREHTESQAQNNSMLESLVESQRKVIEEQRRRPEVERLSKEQVAQLKQMLLKDLDLASQSDAFRSHSFAIEYTDDIFNVLCCKMEELLDNYDSNVHVKKCSEKFNVVVDVYNDRVRALALEFVDFLKNIYGEIRSVIQTALTSSRFDDLSNEEVVHFKTDMARFHNAFAILQEVHEKQTSNIPEWPKSCLKMDRNESVSGSDEAPIEEGMHPATTSGAIDNKNEQTAAPADTPASGETPSGETPGQLILRYQRENLECKRIAEDYEMKAGLLHNDLGPEAQKKAGLMLKIAQMQRVKIKHNLQLIKNQQNPSGLFNRSKVIKKPSKPNKNAHRQTKYTKKQEKLLVKFAEKLGKDLKMQLVKPVEPERRQPERASRRQRHSAASKCVN